MARPLLILRPQPGGDRTAAAARALGLSVVLRPLFEERPVAWDAPDPGLYDAMILTSARAVRLAGPGLARLADLCAYAVGDTTAAAARERGLTVAATGAADAAALIDQAAAAGARRLLWLCGRNRRASVVPDGVRLDPVVVYAAHPAPLPSDWDALIAAGPVVLVHSARAATLLAAQVGAPRADISIVAISAAAAAAAGRGWRDLLHAAVPRDGAMLALAAKLCQDAGMGLAARES